jgi:anti-sigma regulatory factor (Ser/Thr protein kinase)
MNYIILQKMTNNSLYNATKSHYGMDSFLCLAGGNKMVYTFFSLAEFADKREIIRAILREYCQDQGNLLYVALNEAVNNAFIHGYQGCPSAPVQVCFYVDRNDLVIMVKHEGRGIQSVGHRKDRSEISWEEHGRGLDIIRACTDCFEYNAAGTELIMRKQLGSHQAND